MGANFTALFDYKIEMENLKALAHRLNDKDQFKYFYSVAHLFDEPSISCWKWSEDPFWQRSIEDEFICNGFVSMGGPGGLTLIIGKQLCELSSNVRWGTFLGNMKIRNHLRKISHELSGIFGNPIYAPDLFCLDAYLFDEESIREAKEWLLKEYGQPSDSIDEMAKDSQIRNEYRKYYIETFNDLT